MEARLVVPVYGSLIVIMGFVFSSPAVNRVTGITFGKFTLLVTLHVTLGIVPYLCWKGFGAWRFTGVYLPTLVVGLCCLIVYMSGSPSSFLWVFYLLYAGVAGNAFGFNVYTLLILAAAPLATGLALHLNGLMSAPSTQWLNIALITILGTVFHFYTGSMVSKYYLLLQKSAELEKTLELERERVRLAREIHDGVSSEFTGIIAFSERAGHLIGTTVAHEAALEFIDQIERASRRGIREVRNIILALDPENQSLKLLTAHIRRHAHDLLSSGAIDLTIEESEQEDICLSSSTIMTILCVTQEACHNILKHSGADAVRIWFRTFQPWLEIEISDNGRGFVPETNTPGNGLRNMRERAKKAGAEFSLTSVPGQGTTISLRLPLA